MELVDGNALVQYVAQDQGSKESDEDLSDQIENTIFRDLYGYAAKESSDELLLQSCNKIFGRPKQTKGNTIAAHAQSTVQGQTRTRNAEGDPVLDFLEMYPQLIGVLQKRIFLIIDATDSLCEDDQMRFAQKLLKLRNIIDIKLHILIACRSSSRMQISLSDANISEISVSEHIQDDISLVIKSGIDMIPNLSEAERNEIEDAIKQKRATGSDT